MEDAAYAFQSHHGRFPRDIAELRRFAAARHLALPLQEFVRLRIRCIDAQQSWLEGETKPPESDSQGRRLIVTY